MTLWVATEQWSSIKSGAETTAVRAVHTWSLNRISGTETEIRAILGVCESHERLTMVLANPD